MSTAVRSRVFNIPAAAIAIGLGLFSQDDVSASIKERRVERLNAQIYRVYEYGFRGFYVAERHRPATKRHTLGSPL